MLYFSLLSMEAWDKKKHHFRVKRKRGLPTINPGHIKKVRLTPGDQGFISSVSLNRFLQHQTLPLSRPERRFGGERMQKEI